MMETRRPSCASERPHFSARAPPRPADHHMLSDDIVRLFLSCRYLVGAPEVTGDLTPLLWALRQTGLHSMYLPPGGKITANGDDGLEDEEDDEQEPAAAASEGEPAGGGD